MDQPEAPQPIRQCDAERVIFRKLKALYDGNHKEHCWHILNRVIPPELFSGLGLRAKQPGSLPSKKKSQPNSDSAPSGSGYSGTGPPSKLFKNKKGKAVKPVAVEIPPDQNDPDFAHYHAVRQLADQQEAEFQEARKRKRIAEQEKKDAYDSKSFQTIYKINLTYFVYFSHFF